MEDKNKDKVIEELKGKQIEELKGKQIEELKGKQENIAKISKNKKEEKIENKQKKQIIQKKTKKDSAIVNGISLPISTKDSIAICRFIRYKKIDSSLEYLEDVLKKKRFIPMKGEIPHRKGKSKMSSGSGRYPVNSVKVFIKLLKSLKANAENNLLENPIISISSASNASRPFGRFGRVKKKRTNVKLIAKEKKQIKKNNKKWKKEKQ